MRPSTARVALIAISVLVVSYYGLRAFDLRRLEYGEGPILAMVERWRQEPVGPAWKDGPHCTVTCYGPGYYWAVMALSPVTPWDHTLIPGRLINLFAMIATAVLLARIVRRATGNGVLSDSAALLYIVSPVVWYWLPFHRVDSLAVLFAIGAYAVIDGAAPGKLRVLLSAMLVVLGSLVKQPVVLSAVPIVVYFWCNGRRGAALLTSAAVVGLGGAIWLLLAWASGGYLLEGAILGNMNPFELESLSWKLSRFFGSFLGISTLIVIACLFITSRERLTSSLYLLAFVCSAAFSSFLVGKEGSNINYFLETAALAAIILPIYGLAPLWQHEQERTALVVAAAAVFLGVCCLRPVASEQRAPMPGASPLLRATPANCKLLADTHCMNLLIAEGKQPLVNDPYLYRLLVENGVIDPTGLVDAMAAGTVERLLLHWPVDYHADWPKYSWEYRKWPAPVVEAMQRHYVLESKEDGLHFYLHKKLAAKLD